MTSTLPSGGGKPEGAEPDGALDPDSAPATGLDPDTAPDAAGERDTSTANTPSETTDLAVQRSAAPADESGQPLIGDPALDNEDEMRQAGADLQSSREKAATARDISDRLTAATRPEAADGERS